MFEKLFNKTKVKLLVTSFINTSRICTVYDTGQGAFIYDYIGSIPRYLKSDGTFDNPEYRTCNGDPVSWKPHIGDSTNLRFQIASK